MKQFNKLHQSRSWVASLLVTILLLAGCAATDQPVVVSDPATDDQAVEATETPAEADTMSETDTMTETDTMSDSDTMTETDMMTDTDTMTDTGMTTGVGTAGMENADNLLVTATSLTDYNFVNIDDEVSGSLQDVILDVNTGDILYVTIEYGGFLDIGDKEMPMPLNAFVWNENGELVLNFDEAMLNDFPDLDPDWLNPTDPSWDDEVHTFWNDIGLGNSNDFTEATDSIAYADDLIGYGISDIGTGVNTVNDMLVDFGQSQVKYVVMAADPVATGGDLIAVPFDAFDFSISDSLLTFRNDINQDVLQNAPRFAPEELLGGNPQLYTDNDTYWNDMGYNNDVNSNN